MPGANDSMVYYLTPQVPVTLQLNAATMKWNSNEAEGLEEGRGKKPEDDWEAVRKQDL